MRVLFLGDIVGRAGRDAVTSRLPQVRKDLRLDFVVANGDNPAGGFGITPAVCEELYGAGVDCITGGNHTWDQREIIPYIDSDKKVLRPLNHVPGTPGRGAGIYETTGGRKAMVISLLGRVFMSEIGDPFAAVDAELAKVRLGGTVDFIFVDIHAEATSEKMAMAQYLDGRVSLVAGTHSHIPTADAQVLPNGTAYQTDAGMCGDYDSVIGMEKSEPISRFRGSVQKKRFQPAEGEGTMCAVFVETDDKTGLATHVAPFRQGGRLAPAIPDPA